MFSNIRKTTFDKTEEELIRDFENYIESKTVDGSLIIT